jgi:hypothetical protein
MKRLARYLGVYVDPTFDEFHANRTSHRLAFLTCVAIFHSIDRVAEETGESRSKLRQKWAREYQDFGLVDVLAHHFKHVKSSAERIPRSRPGIPIAFALGLSDSGETMNIRDLYYVIRDVVRFVHRKAGTERPALPEPSARQRPPAKGRPVSKKQ